MCDGRWVGKEADDRPGTHAPPLRSHTSILCSRLCRTANLGGASAFLWRGGAGGLRSSWIEDQDSTGSPTEASAISYLARHGAIPSSALPVLLARPSASSPSVLNFQLCPPLGLWTAEGSRVDRAAPGPGRPGRDGCRTVVGSRPGSRIARDGRTGEGGKTGCVSRADRSDGKGRDGWTGRRACGAGGRSRRSAGGRTEGRWTRDGMVRSAMRAEVDGRARRAGVGWGGGRQRRRSGHLLLSLIS